MERRSLLGVIALGLVGVPVVIDALLAASLGEPPVARTFSPAMDVEAMRQHGREAPTLDTGLVAVASALGLPEGTAVGLFAVSRASGWIAHALEQRAAGFVLRPRARYVGPAAEDSGEKH